MARRAALMRLSSLGLRNPAPGTNFETARTLVGAYQMILPGETAPSHRHSSHALRVVIDGKGSYSIVEGQRIPMETGDVVLTPDGAGTGMDMTATDRPIGSMDSMSHSRNCWNRCSMRNIRKNTNLSSA
jgi:gentisate 1,2-dioxygenase